MRELVEQTESHALLVVPHRGHARQPIIIWSLVQNHGVLTSEAEAMKAIVAANAAALKEAGFRKRRHCFNRPTADGLVHVVFFWQAPKEPPAWTEVPGLRERLYGSYRIDIGVWAPEMTRMGTPRSSWINDYDCQLRMAPYEMLTGDDAGDLWWPLNEPDAATKAGDYLREHALPWLDRFTDKPALLDRFETEGLRSLGMNDSGALEIAELYQTTGHPGDARRILEEYVSRPIGHAGHADYLREYLPSIGQADLADRVHNDE